MRGSKYIKWIDQYIGSFIIWIFTLFRRRVAVPEAPTKVLLVLFGALGDALLLIPAIRLLSEGGVKQIDVLCDPKNRELFSALSEVSTVYSLSTRQALRSPMYALRSHLLLMKNGYDAVIDAEQYICFSAIFTITLKSFCVGFRLRGVRRHLGYDTFISRSHAHISTDYCRLVSCLVREESKMISTQRSFLLPSTITGKLDGKRNNILLVHVGGGGSPKHAYQRIWPATYYLECLKSLINLIPDITIWMTGTAEEYDLVDGILSELPSDITVNLVGQTSLIQLVKIVQSANVVLCGNTGVMHLASACDVPVVALHGPTDPLKWGPLNKNAMVISATTPCSPCLDLGYEFGCKLRTCMESIQISNVVDAIMEAFQAHIEIDS